jgi:hypothetical protein
MNADRFRILTVAFAGLLLWNCAAKTGSEPPDEHNSSTAGDGVWKAMDDFHMVMAETFHPFKDSANLEPAKTRADELLTAADEWARAPLPEKVDNDDMRSKLQRLRSEAATLAESVRSSDDNVVGEHLTRLHDTFHSIQEAWYSEGH